MQVLRRRAGRGGEVTRSEPLGCGLPRSEPSSCGPPNCELPCSGLLGCWPPGHQRAGASASAMTVPLTAGLMSRGDLPSRDALPCRGVALCGPELLWRGANCRVRATARCRCAVAR